MISTCLILANKEDVIKCFMMRFIIQIAYLHPKNNHKRVFNNYITKKKIIFCPGESQ